MAVKNQELKALGDKLRGSNPPILQQARQFALKFLLQNTDLLENLNRAQLEEGKYADGSTIQDGYSDLWGIQRVMEGKQVRFVDLNFTGDFYKSITADPTLYYVEFNTVDPKIHDTKLHAGAKVRFDAGGALGLSQANAIVVGWRVAQGIRDNLMNYLIT